MGVKKGMGLKKKNAASPYHIRSAQGDQVILLARKFSSQPRLPFSIFSAWRQSAAEHGNKNSFLSLRVYNWAEWFPLPHGDGESHGR